jgi:DNA-binding protein H-NS
VTTAIGEQQKRVTTAIGEQQKRVTTAIGEQQKRVTTAIGEQQKRVTTATEKMTSGKIAGREIVSGERQQGDKRHQRLPINAVLRKIYVT